MKTKMFGLPWLVDYLLSSNPYEISNFHRYVRIVECFDHKNNTSGDCLVKVADKCSTIKAVFKNSSIKNVHEIPADMDVRLFPFLLKSYYFLYCRSTSALTNATNEIFLVVQDCTILHNGKKLAEPFRIIDCSTIFNLMKRMEGHLAKEPSMLLHPLDVSGIPDVRHLDQVTPRVSILNPCSEKPHPPPPRVDDKWYKSRPLFRRTDKNETLLKVLHGETAWPCRSELKRVRNYLKRAFSKVDDRASKSHDKVLEDASTMIRRLTITKRFVNSSCQTRKNNLRPSMNKKKKNHPRLVARASCVRSHGSKKASRKRKLALEEGEESLAKKSRRLENLPVEPVAQNSKVASNEKITPERETNKEQKNDNPTNEPQGSLGMIRKFVFKAVPSHGAFKKPLEMPITTEPLRATTAIEKVDQGKERQRATCEASFQENIKPLSPSVETSEPVGNSSDPPIHEATSTDRPPQNSVEKDKNPGKNGADPPPPPPPPSFSSHSTEMAEINLEAGNLASQKSRVVEANPSAPLKLNRGRVLSSISFTAEDRRILQYGKDIMKNERKLQDGSEISLALSQRVVDVAALESHCLLRFSGASSSSSSSSTVLDVSDKTSERIPSSSSGFGSSKVLKLRGVEDLLRSLGSRPVASASLPGSLIPPYQVPRSQKERRKRKRSPSTEREEDEDEEEEEEEESTEEMLDRLFGPRVKVRDNIPRELKQLSFLYFRHMFVDGTPEDHPP